MKTQGERHSGRDVNAGLRAAEAMKLRKLGWTYEDIAKQCGYANRGIAWNAVQRELIRTLHEAAEPLRKMEAERLNDLMRPFMLRAMKGEKDAAYFILHLMERRAKLLGLDMVATGGLPEGIRREFYGVDVADLQQRLGEAVSPNGRSKDTVHP